jgi:hypothetical protein
MKSERNPTTESDIDNVDAAVTETATTEVTEAIADPIRVLRKASCKSLSGKSTIGYEICCDQNSQINIRLASNSGGGLFNKGCLPVSRFFTLEGEPIGAANFKALFAYKSANTAGFVRAILQSENLVTAEGYKAFLAKAKTWVDGTAVEDVGPTKKPTLSLKAKSKKAA